MFYFSYLGVVFFFFFFSSFFLHSSGYQLQSITKRQSMTIICHIIMSSENEKRSTFYKAFSSFFLLLSTFPPSKFRNDFVHHCVGLKNKMLILIAVIAQDKTNKTNLQTAVTLQKRKTRRKGGGEEEEAEDQGG